MKTLPKVKPKASRAIVTAKASSAYGETLPAVYVLAVRGYYRDTMGKAGVNDVGIYDDALFIVSPHGFSSWNGNTDPSRFGWNTAAKKFMARLKAGCWEFRRLKHHPSRPTGYMAFGQGAAPVTVQRVKADGTVHNEETGCFGINLHRGGISGTSSEGCVTLPAEQWPAYYGQLAAALELADQKTFPLILVEDLIS
jgi:lysozyme